MGLRSFEELIGQGAIGGNNGLLIADATDLAFESFDLCFFEKPLVELVGLEDHGVEIFEYLLLSLLLVLVVLGEGLEQRRVLLLLFLQQQLLQLPVQHVFLE